MRLLCAIALTALAGLAGITALPGTSEAQLVREHDAKSLRSFHGAGARIRRSFQSDAEARAVLRQILSATGLAGIEDRIILRASAETPNAEAYIENNERLIFYNAVFMQELAKQTKDYWSLVAILAHELGHHVRFHTAIPGRDHEFELEADYQAGFILRRLGATLDQAQAAFTKFPDVATPTHPGRAQRLQAVTIGWTDGGASQTPTWAQPAQTTPPPVTSAIPAPGKLAVATPPPSARCDGVEVAVGASERRCFKPGAGKTEQFKDCPTCPEMVAVPAGRFTMGSPKDEPQRDEDEDQLSVSIARPFAVGRFAVTRGEFAAFVAATGHKSDGGCTVYTGGEWKAQADAAWRSVGFSQTDRHPVVCVSWNDAKAYAAWLTSTTGKTYRLLAESEREYVARAGTTTPFWWGSAITPTQANYDGTVDPYKGGGSQGEYRKATVAVDSFAANPWGLYNVHGNVWEWTEDCSNGKNVGNPGNGSARTSGDCSSRIDRGGSWISNPQYLRSANRNRNTAGSREFSRGFRVARTL